MEISQESLPYEKIEGIVNVLDKKCTHVKNLKIFEFIGDFSFTVY